MKQAFKDVWTFIKNFFKSYLKLRDMETSISNSLTKDYISYQANPTVERLHRLMIVVSFCQQTGINGRTTEIQNKIAEAWLALTTK